jgi:hypothetical protein
MGNLQTSSATAQDLDGARLDLEENKLTLERDKLELERLRFERESSLRYRASQGLAAGIAAAIPLVVALLVLYGTLRTGGLESETSQRLRAAELILADVEPTEVSRRIAIVSRLMPDVRQDLDKLVDVDALESYLANSLSADYQLYWTADEARLAFFNAASAKASCAQEVSELWRLMFGPDRVRDDPNVPGYEWAANIDLSGACPVAPSPNTSQ